MQTQKPSKAGTRRRKTEQAPTVEMVAAETEKPESIALTELDAIFAPEVVELTVVKVEPAIPVKVAKVLPTPDEALAAARVKNPGRFAHVVRVTEQTVKGEPKRVVIACQKPETKMVGVEAVSVCDRFREIAVQDLFQVTQCASCADRSVRKARRNRAKARDKAIRAQLREMRGGR